MIVITFGTFDLLHVGHINIFKKSKELGDKLIVGISTDNFTFRKKQKYPVYNEKHRKEILDSIKYIDETFFEESFEKKREYILKHKADILVMGSDWKNKFDHFNDICKVVYFERTPDISTTETIYKIKN